MSDTLCVLQPGCKSNCPEHKQCRKDALLVSRRLQGTCVIKPSQYLSVSDWNQSDFIWGSKISYLNYEPEFPFILVMVRVFSSISLEHFSLNSARVENERERERGQTFFCLTASFQIVSGPLSCDHALLLSVLDLTSTITIIVLPSSLHQMPAKMDESVLNGCPGLRNDRRNRGRWRMLSCPDAEEEGVCVCVSESLPKSESSLVHPRWIYATHIQGQPVPRGTTQSLCLAHNVLTLMINVPFNV